MRLPKHIGLVLTEYRIIGFIERALKRSDDWLQRVLFFFYYKERSLRILYCTTVLLERQLSISSPLMLRIFVGSLDIL